KKGKDILFRAILSTNILDIEDFDSKIQKHIADYFSNAYNFQDIQRIISLYIDD
ncbi:10705_t:CDS:2, partial [Funneliformis geosporum]